MGGAESLIELLEDQKRRAGGHRACFMITPTLLRLIHRQPLVWEAQLAVNAGLGLQRYLGLLTAP